MLDHDLLRSRPEEAMARALSGGVRLFQYRDKSGPRRSIYETARLLAPLAHQSQATFIVNDHADIAAAADADGVHLGQDDLPIEAARRILGRDKIIGISTHDADQARTAEKAGADYIGFGPLFVTTTKMAGTARGTESLALIRQSVSVPIFAIGGINSRNVADVMRAGADGAAVISAVLSAPDVAEAAEEMVRIIRTAGAAIQKPGGHT
ncbi:MAG TPA: thiamine phosphate synthase [Nitrospirota bacterium]|nr:thiamine phosphate synthase [Nitrospirota bacterium]